MTRVLIVDDKAENLVYLHSLLSKHGYIVDSARHGEEALAKAQKVFPDLVISDLLMPVMDGFTLLRHWKTEPRFKKIPFIVYTANFTDADDKRFGENLGADAFIFQPVRAQVFLSRVKEVQAAAAVTSPGLQYNTQVDDEEITRKYYSERLINKLEEKTQLLEQSNSALQQEIRKHQLAEEEVSFNNTILKTQLKNSLDAILVVSKEGNVLSYNDQYVELFCIAKELLEACRNLPLLQSPPILQVIENKLKDPQIYLSTMKYLHENRNEKSFEQIRFKNGKIIDLYSAPAIGSKEQYYGRIWYFRDVTESKRIQATLKAGVHEQQQLAQMLEIERSRLVEAQRIGRMGSWSSDERTGLTNWTDATCELFGIDPKHFTGTAEQFHSLILPEDLPAFEEAVARISVSNPLMEMEYRIRGRDGVVRWMYTRGNVEFDASGAVVSRAGIVMDITEKKAAEKEILGLGNRLVETLENISDAFFTVDSNWNFIYLNENAERFLLRNREDLLGRNIWEEFKEALGTPIEFNYRRASAEQVALSFEEFYPPLNTWFEINVYPSRDGLAMYFRDVTERKATEAQLAYLNRVRAVLSGINALIVRATDREELFREACQIAYKSGEFRMVMLCIVNPDTMIIEPVAYEGKDESLMETVRSAFASVEQSPQTMVARAIRTNKAIVSNDCAQDPQVLFADSYLASGVQSIAVLPMVSQEKSIGVLVLYAREIGFFQNDEMSLLTKLADDITFAIDHIAKLERLDYLADFDTLTGLPTHELFLERLGQFMSKATDKLCICILNLARFKNVNDTLGRRSGDVLLQLVAEWLIRNTGDARKVARVGADQFAVVFSIRPQGDLIKLFESINRTLEETAFKVGETTLRIAARSGIVVFPDDGTDADTLFRNAEVALKGSMANNERFTFYTKSMNIAVASRLALENKLRQAVSNKEFLLYYQPKMNLHDGKITGAEALIRWKDSEGNLVLPGNFIPMLEETGMIADVGRWALGKAVEDYLRWRKEGLSAVRIAVNVSPLQLKNRNFIFELEKIAKIDEHAVQGLELEITEGLIMDDIHGSTESLKAIRAMGITVAIDDFGTGFSSLGYLSKLPVDSLKIDRTFVVDMTGGPEGMALVSTIIDLARALKLKVVAEGVETEEQMRLLRLLQCDEIQGYLLGRPVPVAEFEKKFLHGNFSLGM